MRSFRKRRTALVLRRLPPAPGAGIRVIREIRGQWIVVWGGAARREVRRSGRTTRLRSRLHKQCGPDARSGPTRTTRWRSRPPDLSGKRRSQGYAGQVETAAALPPSL
jgi:hypothetical protein